ncbi:phosphatase PAP2 family protein [Brevundimonas sp. SORGH_AS_0993]|uniref:phosphatase PAP2 family protein n=1 Tax=Brevundimonas sp. SORGH_AS_0993 TaxID=3041794 RepID=UPI00278A1E23|nr:phosphatase PAP2 family protein [Brevundimonas sp. SORGH_AS_0993]MDQ1155076.1 lipid A 4'-phosphatase [Brevundimonas sp. SORGH_AS_0993]
MSDAALTRPVHAPSRARAPLVRSRRAGRFGPDEGAILAATGVLAVSVAFLLFPGVDIAVSRLFYRPEAGFVLGGDPVLKALRKSSTWVLALMLLGALGRLIWAWVRRRPWGDAGRRALFVISALALGPGLTINLVFKELWGRARPIQIEAFGGHAPFTPVWMFSDACRNNCSFVSGEGAGAAWMVGAALVLTPARWRPVVLPTVVLYAAALSMNRLVFGGHFLSDILLSWGLTAMVMLALHRVTEFAPGRGRRRRQVSRLSALPA